MSVSTSLVEVTPRQARELIIDAITSDVVPFVRSSPGIGKSAIMASIAKQFNLELIDLRLSTCAPEDLSGLPEFYDDIAGNRRARFVPFEMFPAENTPLPEGKEGWMLFFDEMNHATKEVQAAAYKPILDHYVGQTRMHQKLVKTAAGNLDTDRALTNQLSTAMQSRVAHLQMRYDHKEWRDDVMVPNAWDMRIISFIEQFPSKGMDFRPDHNDRTFACPRTWEFLNRTIKGKTFKIIEKEHGQKEFEMQRKLPLYGGTIGTGMAAEFVNYCRVWGELPPIQAILADPLGMKVPTDNTICWATIGSMCEYVSEENFGDLATYSDRMAMNFRVLFYRMALRSYPTLRNHPEFTSKASTLAKYLYG